MNLFTGFTDHQKVSTLLTFILFNGFVVLEAIALTAFYLASKPRLGRVRSAAIWHFVAALWFLLAIVSTVWAAPAQKSFLDDNGDFFGGDRFSKVLIGAAFALVGIACLVVGLVRGGRQRRSIAQAEFFAHESPRTARRAQPQ